MGLLPKQEEFYQYFREQADLIVRASDALLRGVRGVDGDMTKCAGEIKDLERRGDEVTREVITKLNRTFITPLDPEDIHRLATSLDAVLDRIEGGVHRISAYRLSPIPPSVASLCDVTSHCAGQIEAAVRALQRKEPVDTFCREIHRLEEEADVVLWTALSELFNTAMDPIELIKQKEILQLLEKITDCCQDVSDVIENVLVKNA